MSDVVARQVRHWRRGRGWTMAQLAERCAQLGAPQITENALENLEYGRRSKDGRRRRAVTVDDLLVLAVALDVAPVHLLVPVDSDLTPYPMPVNWMQGNAVTREWIRGRQAPAVLGADERLYFSQVPADEFRRWSPREVEGDAE